MTRPLLILALLLAAIVGCVRTVDLGPVDANLPDAFDDVPDAQQPLPDASPLPDAEIDADPGAPDAAV
jgi:hypothetical protein